MVRISAVCTTSTVSTSPRAELGTRPCAKRSSAAWERAAVGPPALRPPPRARVTSASVESSATGVMTAAIRGTPGRAARKFSRPVPARQTFSLIEGWFPTCSGRIPPLASRVWVAAGDRDRLSGDTRFDPGRAQQTEILHVARADLDHVGILFHLFEAFMIDRFGDDCETVTLEQVEKY